MTIQVTCQAQKLDLKRGAIQAGDPAAQAKVTKMPNVLKRPSTAQTLQDSGVKRRKALLKVNYKLLNSTEERCTSYPIIIDEKAPHIQSREESDSSMDVLHCEPNARNENLAEV